MHASPDRGITLVELLFALAIAATLAMVATPSLQAALDRTRLAQAQNTLLGAVSHARGLAIFQGVPAILCPTEDGLNCAAVGDWNAGWLAGRDVDRDDQPDAAPEFAWPGAPARVRILGSRGRQRLRFQPDGSAGGSNMTLVLCIAGQPASARTIVISNPGRPRAGAATPAQASACAAA